MTGRIAALAVCAVALGLGEAGARAEKPPGFVGCRSFVSRSAEAVVRPRSIVLACADANLYVTGLKWSRWDVREADGAGLGHENDCTPYCAAGHFHTYRVTLRLSGVETCGSRREPQFTHVAWRFAGEKPAGVARGGGESFRCG